MEAVSIVNYFVAAYFGLIIGNFATSFYFRVPRDISLLGFSCFSSMPPSCSYCRHPLKVKEYIPIVGYLLCKGQCNYCKAKVDSNYLIIEAFALLLSLFCYSQFYFSDWYLIFVFFGISSLVMSMLLLNHKEVNKNFIFFVVFCGIIYSTLINLGIYDWVFKLAISAIIFILIMYSSYRYNLDSTHSELLKILFVAFVWFDLRLMILYALFMLANYFLSMRYKLVFTKYVYCYSYVIIFLIIIVNHLAKI